MTDNSVPGLIGQKIAILAANGFQEPDLIETQKILNGTGAHTRIVGMDQGLINGWNDGAWGLNFAVDQAINTALAADYSILIVPGGQRSIDKLGLTAHTNRFLKGFLDSRKPVILFREAETLLADGKERDTTAPYTIEDNLMVVNASFADDKAIGHAMVEFLTAHTEVDLDQVA